MEHYYIVVQIDKDRLTPKSMYTEKRLADNHAEILRINDTPPLYEYKVLEAVEVVAETQAEADARLGDFNATPKGSLADVAPGFASA